MAHNPPDPARFIQNNPTYRAMLLVAWRYGEEFTANANMAVEYVAPRLKAGIPPMHALEAFEGRPMNERRYGRPPPDVAWEYDER